MNQRPMGLVAISIWLLATAVASIYYFFHYAAVMERGASYPIDSVPYATLPLVFFFVLVVHLLSGAYLYQGRDWARSLYLWASPCIILLVVVRSVVGPAPGTGLAVAVLGGTYLAALGVLFQASTRSFLSRPRPQ